jgi:hypothetical protein
MVKATKKKKVKSVSSTISSPPPAGSSKNSANDALRSVKFKYHAGKFSASSKTIRSEVNAGAVPLEAREVRWDEIAETNGWDPAYIESFLEQDTLPPATDPELPKRSRGVSIAVHHKRQKLNTLF